MTEWLVSRPWDLAAGLVGERPWLGQAACKGAPQHIFYPTRGDTGAYKQARTVCARCPVRAECLDDALERGELHGMWGGKSERERKKMRRARKLDEAA